MDVIGIARELAAPTDRPTYSLGVLALALPLIVVATVMLGAVALRLHERVVNLEIQLAVDRRCREPLTLWGERQAP